MVIRWNLELTDYFIVDAILEYKRYPARMVDVDRITDLNVVLVKDSNNKMFHLYLIHLPSQSKVCLEFLLSHLLSKSGRLIRFKKILSCLNNRFACLKRYQNTMPTARQAVLSHLDLYFSFTRGHRTYKFWSLF